MKNKILSCVILLSISIAGGCETARPTFVLRGPVTASQSISEASFDASGLRLAVESRCERLDTEVRCSPPTRECISKRKVVFRCPDSPMSVHAPWGKVYQGPAASIPIRWKDAAIDPLSAESPAALKRSWEVRSADGALVHSFVPSDASLASMLVAIGSALDAQHRVESPVRPTELSIRFVETGVPNRLAIEITNTGDASAYEVRAHLRTGFSPLHGTEVVFGRIGPKRSKTWSRDVPVAAGEQDSSPMIVAEVKASNAGATSASSRVRLAKAPDGLGAFRIECQAIDPKAGPEARARVRCKVTNHGKATVRSLTYEIRNGSGKPIAGTGPAEIAGGGQADVAFAVPVPPDAKIGAKLSLSAAVRSRSGVLASPSVVVEVAAGPAACTGKITQAQYRAKLEELRALLAADAITQAELDKYDSELLECLQMPAQAPDRR